MFGTKKKAEEVKQPVSVVLVPEVAAYASAASFPVDSNGNLVFLDDTVEYHGEQFQVVCMSHRNHIVIREPNAGGSGGKWVPSRDVTVTKHVLGVR